MNTYNDSNLRPHLLLLVILFTMLMPNGCGKITVPGNSTVIKNCTVIDGNGGTPLARGMVVIDDGKIWAVGPETKFRLPGSVKQLDAEQGFALPGLINTHVHISNTKSMESWTRSGVTTVRDLGGPLGIVLARKFTRNSSEPRLFVAGPILTVPKGYPIPSWGDKVAKVVNSPREAETVVGDLIDSGVDVIKIAVTEGFDKEWPTLSMDEINAITSAAHRRGKKVVAHVLRAKDARRAIEGGVDALAHDVIDELPQDLIAAMVKKEIVLIPTLSVLLQGVDSANWAQGWQREDSRQNLFLNIRRLTELGGLVALGDDFGVVGVEMGLPLEELRMLQDAGLSASQVLSIATKQAARAIDKEEELGTLEAGKIADILIVKSDPTEDIANLAKVKGVVFKGNVLRWE